MKTIFHFQNTDASLSNLDDEARTLFNEVCGVTNAMPASIWPEKSKRQKGKSVLQSVHNYDLKLELDARGWELEPYVYEQDRSVRRADFNKGVGAAKVVIEAEFGNASRTDSAQVKFQTAYLNNALKLAIMIVATNKMAKLTDSGLTTFEQTRAYFSGLHPAMVAYPLVVIGLEFDESTTVLDWSKSQFSDAECLSGNSGCNNIVHALSEYKAGVVIDTIGVPQAAELAEVKTLRARLNKPSSTGVAGSKADSKAKRKSSKKTADRVEDAEIKLESVEADVPTSLVGARLALGTRLFAAVKNCMTTCWDAIQPPTLKIK